MTQAFVAQLAIGVVSAPILTNRSDLAHAIGNTECGVTRARPAIRAGNHSGDSVCGREWLRGTRVCIRPAAAAAPGRNDKKVPKACFGMHRSLRRFCIFEERF